jgi:hypothetical protein
LATDQHNSANINTRILSSTHGTTLPAGQRTSAFQGHSRYALDQIPLQNADSILRHAAPHVGMGIPIMDNCLLMIYFQVSFPSRFPFITILISVLTTLQRYGAVPSQRRQSKLGILEDLLPFDRLVQKRKRARSLTPLKDFNITVSGYQNDFCARRF